MEREGGVGGLPQLGKRSLELLQIDLKQVPAAVQGMITLWDVEGGLPQLDKYLYSSDPAVVAGALLGVGIVNSNVRVSQLFLQLC